MKFICVVPVYNEDKRLQVLLEEINYVKKLHKNLDFVIFDNGSNDNSTKIISNYNIKNFKFKKNYGVGYALISGLKYAINNNYDAVIHLAGNGKMNPEQINKVIRPIRKYNCDFVSGSRFLIKGGIKNTPYYTLLKNSFILISTVLLNLSRTLLNLLLPLLRLLWVMSSVFMNLIVFILDIIL